MWAFISGIILTLVIIGIGFAVHYDVVHIKEINAATSTAQKLELCREYYGDTTVRNLPAACILTQ